MKKHILPLLLLGIVFLFVACDGAILSNVVNSTESVSKKYQNIIGINGSKVYYQLSTGIYSNVSRGGSETQIVANSENHIVRGSAFVTDSSGSATYLMYITNNATELQSGEIHFVSLDGATSTTANISGFTSGTSEIVAMYTNGSVLVRSENATDTSTYDFTLYSSPTYNGSSLTFASCPSIPLSTDYGVDMLYLQTGREHDSSAIGILSFANEYESEGDTDYEYSYYKVNFTEGKLTKITGKLTSYQMAGFTVDGSDNIYAITTGGRLYKAASDGTFAYKESLGYSYEPTSMFMYRVDSGTTNYLITKSSTKNSALIVYTFDDDASSFSSTTVRYGYAKKIVKDLVNAAYEISEKNLLVATNESGMVSIKIESPASNTTGNGSSSDFEKYEF